MIRLIFFIGTAVSSNTSKGIGEKVAKQNARTVGITTSTTTDYCRKHKISLFCNDLAFYKNQTKISKEATENTTTIESSDHPNHGELENFLCTQDAWTLI